MRQICSTLVTSGASAHHKVLGGGVDSLFAIRDDGECLDTLRLTFVLTMSSLRCLAATESGGLH